jgi:hypothetical protein
MKTRKQATVVEHHDGEWLLMHDDGAVEVFETPSAALQSVRRAAKRGNTSVTLTTVEWRNIPEGFTPPEA